jgi:arsenite oxidase small subunit
MKRRNFVKICASAVASISASPELLAEPGHEMHQYQRVALTQPVTGERISAASIEVGETYLFHYPYVTTPCFLINLGRPVTISENLKTGDGGRYQWPGGCGPNHSVVAFSAICAHRMSHPAPSVSFINYRHEKATYRNLDNEEVQSDGVIYCCSEKSVYDPARGGRVLGGPAPQPLAAIALDYVKEDDSFYATATIGGEMFDRYFEAFGQRLILDHARFDIRKPSNENTELVPLREFSSRQMLC